MALEVKGLERVFRFTKNNTKIDLADPDPARTPEQVMSLYANQYPELTTSTVHGPVFEKDKVLYEFKTVIGTKG